MPPRHIDLNSDLGEGFRLPPFGLDLTDLAGVAAGRDGARFHTRHSDTRSDEQVLGIVSSVNLACGMHSGDPPTTRRAVERAVRDGISIGAHPSYPDVFRFGQQRMAMSAEDLAATIRYQFGGLDGIMRPYGRRIAHVKCHGALHFDVSNEADICQALVDAVAAFDPTIAVVLLAGSPNVDMVRAAGLTVVEEIAIDRQYDGLRMVSRNDADAVLTDPLEVADRLSRLVIDRRLGGRGGVEVEVQADTVCLHADTPNMGAIVDAIRARLEADRIAIRPPGRSEI